MAAINKDKLSSIIHKRLDKAITKASVYDAICVICSDLSDRLVDGESISIDNFGTLDTYTYHGHEGNDVSSGEMQYVEPFVSVKFMPHDSLSILLNNKKSNFKT